MHRNETMCVDITSSASTISDMPVSVSDVDLHTNSNPKTCPKNLFNFFKQVSMATLSEYERQRLEQIKKNNEQLALLGLAGGAAKLAPPKPSRGQRKSRAPPAVSQEPTRRCSRLQDPDRVTLMDMRDDIDESDKLIERRHRSKRATRPVVFEEQDDDAGVRRKKAKVAKEGSVLRCASAQDGVDAAELFSLVSTPHIVHNKKPNCPRCMVPFALKANGCIRRHKCFAMCTSCAVYGVTTPQYIDDYGVCGRCRKTNILAHCAYCGPCGLMLHDHSPAELSHAVTSAVCAICKASSVTRI